MDRQEQDRRRDFTLALIDGGVRAAPRWMDYGDGGCSASLRLYAAGSLSGLMKNVVCKAATHEPADEGWHIGGGSVDSLNEDRATLRVYVDFDDEFELPDGPYLCPCGERIEITKGNWDAKHCDDCRRAGAEAREEGER